MSSDEPGSGDEPEETNTGDRFVAGPGDEYPAIRPDGGSHTSRDSLGGRSEPGHASDAAHRGADGSSRSGGDPGRGGPVLEESCPVSDAIEAASAVGHVAHVGPTVEGRFGTERRVRSTAADTSRRVDVRVFRDPDGDDARFEDALARQLHRWATVGDVDGVVPVLDRGDAARPWVATASTGPTLRGRDTPSVSRAMRQAVHLSGALAALHEQGVVHAGIDPANVVFTLGEDGPPRPVLHNPGLVDVYRRYEDPAAVLDPRYAAPEFFESDRGIVDRATDVYGLGVVCFRLFTGVAPVEGSAETIAERVTADDPLPRPSRVEPRLPEAVDDVVRRATATDKFDRYDTAGDLHEALVAARDGRSG